MNNLKRTFFIPLIGTPIYGIKETGYDIPFTVQFLKGAYQKNDMNWRKNERNSCPVVMKQNLTDQQKEQIKNMDAIFGVPPCRFLSMLNVKHDNYASGNSQECMMQIAEESLKYLPSVFCFQNAPRLSSSPVALEWAIPTLASILKPAGYKFTIYKTTTLNHGLPQKRERTFFIAHKSNHKIFDVYKYKNNPVTIEQLIGDLQNQVNNERYISGPQNKLQEWMRKNNSEVTSHKPIESWFYWKELMKYCKDANKSLMWQIMYKGQEYGYNWQKMLREVTNQKDHNKLKAIFEHANKKLAMGKGYWDVSPMLRSGSHVNAIISKNAYRLVHPNRTRLLTLRELSRFMGIPDRFVFHEKSPSSSWHIITQNVPSFTFADVREECKKYITGIDSGEFIKTEKDLVFINNIRGKDYDQYYHYNIEDIKTKKEALGTNKRDFLFKTDKYATSFLERSVN